MGGRPTSLRTKQRSSLISVSPSPKRHPYAQWCPDARALDLVGDKWTLLIVRDLATGPRRFVSLQRTLPGISTEQLRSRLNRMVADELLTRTRYREVPPRVDYELTERARELFGVIGELARWGYKWAWDDPREKEAIDLHALFRLSPGLVAPKRGKHGTVALEIGDGDGHDNGGGRHYWIRVGSGPTEVGEEAAEAPDAVIRGTRSEWQEAMGPRCALDVLSYLGDEDLARHVLGGLCGREPAQLTASVPA